MWYIIHNGILLSYKKECIWVGSNEVDEPRAYYTKWSKSEKEKQILYINPYIWNLERWYWWTYLQGSNGDADRENGLTDKEEGGMNGKSRMETYAFSSVQSLSHVQLFATPWTTAMPGFPVHHQLLELAHTHVHWVGDVIHYNMQNR